MSDELDYYLSTGEADPVPILREEFSKSAPPHAAKDARFDALIKAAFIRIIELTDPSAGGPWTRDIRDLALYAIKEIEARAALSATKEDTP
jgi:hypothetical protein